MKRKPMGLIAALLATTGVVAGVNAQSISFSLTGSGLNLTVNFAGIAEPEAAKSDAKKHDEKALKVIDAYVEKVGGKDAIMAVKSITTVATVEIPMVGLTGTVELHVAQPGKMASVLSLPGMGRFESGYDGTHAWSSDPLNGPRLTPEEEMSGVRRQSDPNIAAKHREIYRTIEYQGEQDFEGQKAHKIRLVRSTGEESTEYYSVDTGLQIGMESVETTPAGDMKVFSVLSDYKQFGALKMPTRVVQTMGPQRMVTTIESVTMNKVDESKFNLPESIKALIAAQED
jgi:hypothetical protein